MLRISLDTQIEDLESNFESEHISYLQQTSQRTHDFKELTQNDQRLTREIETKKKKIDSLQVGYFLKYRRLCSMIANIFSACFTDWYSAVAC